MQPAGLVAYAEDVDSDDDAVDDVRGDQAYMVTKPVKTGLKLSDLGIAPIETAPLVPLSVSCCR